MSTTDILTTSPSPADVQRAADALAAAGRETVMGLEVEYVLRWTDRSGPLARVLVLAAEVVELREALANRNVELEGAASLAADVSALRGLYDETSQALARAKRGAEWVWTFTRAADRRFRAQRRARGLAARLAASEADNAALRARVAAHAAGLSALSATFERACEEAAEPEPEVERAPCEECANYWRCAMEGMADATQRDCAFPESRFEPIGGAA